MVRFHNKAAGISDMPVTSEHDLVFSARYYGTLDATSSRTTRININRIDIKLNDYYNPVTDYCNPVIDYYNPVIDYYNLLLRF